MFLRLRSGFGPKCFSDQVDTSWVLAFCERARCSCGSQNVSNDARTTGKCFTIVSIKSRIGFLSNSMDLLCSEIYAPFFAVASGCLMAHMRRCELVSKGCESLPVCGFRAIKKNTVSPFCKKRVRIINAIRIGNPISITFVVSFSIGHQPKSQWKNTQFPPNEFRNSPPRRPAAVAVLI